MAEKTGRIDRAAICLSEWIERARGYHNSDVWAQWVKDTEAALEQHQLERQALCGLVHVAQMRLLDHNLKAVAAKLNKLEQRLR